MVETQQDPTLVFGIPQMVSQTTANTNTSNWNLTPVLKMTRTNSCKE
ncbi:MAG: hypothetical protein ACLU4J_01305 [Butyricimonas paravirosa]